MNHQAEKSPSPGKRSRRSAISSSGEPKDRRKASNEPCSAMTSLAAAADSTDSLILRRLRMTCWFCAARSMSRSVIAAIAAGSKLRNTSLRAAQCDWTTCQFSPAAKIALTSCSR